VGTVDVPPQIREKYVLSVIDVFLTNGNGVCWASDEIYKTLIQQFDSTQTLVGVLSFRHPKIASKLQFGHSKTKFIELLGLLEGRTSSPAVHELINLIRKYTGPLDDLKNASWISNRVAALEEIIRP
jgi:hypothetical protein